MKTVTITRHETSDNGTFGILNVENEFVCLTLELPWHNNQKNISCIPVGEYNVVYRTTPSYGEKYKILNVPNRSGILFHAGNTIDDTEGCILLGVYLDRDNHAIRRSRKAFEYFYKVTKYDSFKLIINADYDKIEDCMILPPHCHRF